MKKVLSILFILTILGGAAVANQTSAYYDEMPKLTKSFNVSVYDVNHLK
ncbi:hypothetical protein JSQ81_17655 [Sporosarcina sp. Marseille-Q4063]|nr:hypothetical protein [Sporosarcina sp. Marseille-Q4063]QUW21596.1 hypothetical protein JSQ81_17655 [Sporosarcina sp. Marseille-Q4063]